MGGFGALDLALEHPGRFCAVGGHSAALWQRAGATAPGAFDNANDFNDNSPTRLLLFGCSPTDTSQLWNLG